MSISNYNTQTRTQYLNEKITKTQQVIKKILKMNQMLNYNSIEKINRVAYASVLIKHTSQFLIHLGADYYVQVKTNDAIAILQRKIKNYQSKLQSIKKDQHNLVEKQQNKNKKIQRTDKGTIELVGEENGQEIYNIIEMEDQDYTKLYAGSKDIMECIREDQNQLEEVVEQQEESEIQQNKHIKAQNEKKKKIQQKQKQKQIQQKQVKEKNKKNIDKQIKKQKQKIEQVPKKISKFKAQRLRERGQN